MRFMVIVKATAESEKEGALPDPQLMADMGKYNEELIKAGILLALDGLHPSSKRARVKFSGKSRTVVDGPFTEAKELVAGFSILQVKSLEEAIEDARFSDDAVLELRVAHGRGAEHRMAFLVVVNAGQAWFIHLS
jgi:hypothetical protein